MSFTVSTDGRCGPNTGICPDNSCCSEFGFCGLSPNHCGTGCRKPFGACWKTTVSPVLGDEYAVSINDRCGPGYGTRCPDDKCCSSNKFCSTDDDDCRRNCRFGYGLCLEVSDPTTLPNGLTIGRRQCGPDIGVKCAGRSCCSKDGRCGNDEHHCHANCMEGYGVCWDNSVPFSLESGIPMSRNGRCGKKLNTKCDSNHCCSKDGECGSDEDYCEAGCQKGYGRCWKYSPTTYAEGEAPRDLDNKCGRDLGGDGKCRNSNQCCSRSQYCGTSDYYCGVGCIRGLGPCLGINPPNDGPYLSINGQCGVDLDTVCPDAQCCSKNGVCGETKGYCGRECQRDYGVCWGGDTPPYRAQPPPPAKTPSPRSPAQPKTSAPAPAKPKAGYPISADGQCGEGFNTKCPNAQCCSGNGFCGSATGYCGNGCQKDYGVCWDGDKPPKSSAPAPKTDYPISKNNRCGEGFNTQCQDKICCSKHGFCGKTPFHCGVDCQKGYGSCLTPEALARLLAKSSASAPAQPKTSAPAPKTDYPISADGRCGEGFNTQCQDKICCSGKGFCGKTPSHCGDGCQKGYGSCLTPEALASADGRCGKEFKTKCPDRTCCSGSGFCGKTKSHCGDGCQKDYGFCLKPEALARLRGEL
ncbi:hypothetical protein BDEG_20283 [Batrachochytrium dendrobatidis JEL423]|uniref:Chitin-binding type-1 domain-containing protein n=1 Tax=Batrachochytrium dendrobatidis (strain JEL423) TaxID=403673 RepID=A0A177W8X7_BATDL|nr:hypothetical protein BDEG_20283 [Batrachochytrium dendrobatidis JEL423]